MPDPMLIARGTNEVCLVPPIARAAGSQLGRSITRGILGSLFGRKR